MLRIFAAIVLIIMALAIPAADTAAQTQQSASPSSPPVSPLVKETEDFFAGCLKNPVIRSTPANDEAFCACAAANYQAYHSKPATASGGDGILSTVPLNRELTGEKLLSEVYASCLYIPIYDIAYRDCMNDTYSNYFLKHPGFMEGLCDCVADGEESYYRDFMKPFIDLKIAQKVRVDDPIGLMKGDMDYFKANYLLKQQCFATWRTKHSEYVRSTR